MKYIITGKKGSHAEQMTEYIRNKSNCDIEFMLPYEINKVKSDCTIVYVHIPLTAAWDWIMTDPYNNDLRQIFDDEIMEFRELNKWHHQIEYDGGIDWKSTAEKIINVIKGVKNDNV